MIVSQRVGRKSKKLKKYQEEGKKNLLTWRRACGLSNLPWLLATSNYQEVLLQQVQVTINSKSKLLSSGIEPWSVMWNCWLNYGFSGNYLIEPPRTPLETFEYLNWHTELYIPWHVVTQTCKIVSVQNLGPKKPYLQSTISTKSRWMTTL